MPTIVGEIRRHFRDKAWALHVPRRLKELNLKVARLLDELTSDLGTRPRSRSWPAAAEVDEDVIDALESRHAYSARPLSTPTDDDGDGDLLDTLGDEEVAYAHLEDSSLVRSGLEALDERERRIVELRFFQGLTQSQIAAEIGISQMHVSRLLRRALETMRGRLELRGIEKGA